MTLQLINISNSFQNINVTTKLVIKMNDNFTQKKLNKKIQMSLQIVQQLQRITSRKYFSRFLFSEEFPENQKTKPKRSISSSILKLLTHCHLHVSAVVEDLFNFVEEKVFQSKGRLD